LEWTLEKRGVAKPCQKRREKGGFTKPKGKEPPYFVGKGEKRGHPWQRDILIRKGDGESKI